MKEKGPTPVDVSSVHDPLADRSPKVQNHPFPERSIEVLCTDRTAGSALGLSSAHRGEARVQPRAYVRLKDESTPNALKRHSISFLKIEITCNCGRQSDGQAVSIAGNFCFDHVYPEVYTEAKPRSILALLSRQQRAFALYAPGIPRERAVRSHNAMAWYRHRERISCARMPDSAYGVWRSDAARDIRIRRSLSGGNAAQRLPHPLLERGDPHVERQVDAHRRIFDHADDSRDESLELCIAADQLRAWKAILQFARKYVRDRRP